MADLAYRVLDNIRMHLAAITPSETETSAPDSFREWKSLDDDPGDSSGSSRFYRLMWLGSEEDLGITSGYEWTAWHTIQLDVFYSARHPSDDLMRLVMRDRSDIAKRLRVGTANGTRTGWTGATTTKFGLSQRLRVEDSLERSGNLYIFRGLWRCQLEETES